MRSFLSSFTIFFAFLFTTVLAVTCAQAQGLTAQSAPPPPVTVLQANANLVLVDVVVTDHGNAVHGLDQSKFEILEDGKDQKIFSFDEHQPGGAPISANEAELQQLPLHTYTNLPVYPEQGAVNVLLLDALNTPSNDQLRVRQEMIKYLAQVNPGTTLAVFTLSSKLLMVTGFTTDVASLAKLMNGSKTASQPSALLESPTMTSGLTSTSSPLAAQPATPVSASNIGSGGVTNGPMNAAAALSQFEADTSTYQTDLRVRMTLQALQQLAAYLSGIPGRKNLIWVSGSFPLSILPDSSQFSPFGAIADYRDQVEKTTEMLTQSRVAVYPVDGRGLMLPSMFNASTRTAPGNGAMMQEKEGMYQEQGTMDQIADQTGGHAYYETNELKEAVANAVERGASYYTISYVPSAAKLNGEYRKIQVRVDGHDLKLAFRHGYYADGPGKRAPGAPKHMNQTVDGSLHGAPPTTQIIFKAQVLDANDPLLQGVKVPIGPAGELSATLKGPVDRYVVNFTLSPATLALGTEPDGTRTGKIELALIAYNAGGDRVNYVDHQFQLAIKPEQFERVAAKGITVLVPIDLPAGDNSLRIAVNDLNAGRTGSLEVPVTVAAK